MDRRIQRFLKAILLVAVTTSPHIAAADSGKVMLVLDGSGSMWRQIEGEPRVVIARRVVGSLVDELDPGLEVGLMAYGHRRKGDCGDIETLRPVAPLDREALKSAVEAVSPKGKTPLSAATRQAARELRYSEEPATVVLVSDGKETCGMDPCALGSELDATGVDFTAHVIGFDLAEEEERRQLRCLAENTGGRFLNASNARELGGALREVTEVEAAPAPTPETMFAAVDAATGGLVSGGVEWTVIDTATEDVRVLRDQPAELGLELNPGTYEVYVVAGGSSGEATVTVEGNPEERYVIELAPRSGPVSIDASGTVAAGSTLRFDWRGPDSEDDLLFIARPDLDDNRYPASGRRHHDTEDGQPAVLTAPTEPGTYEIRYYSRNNGTVLAKRVLLVR